MAGKQLICRSTSKTPYSSLTSDRLPLGSARSIECIEFGRATLWEQIVGFGTDVAPTAVLTLEWMRLGVGGPDARSCQKRALSFHATAVDSTITSQAT